MHVDFKEVLSLNETPLFNAAQKCRCPYVMFIVTRTSFKRTLEWYFEVYRYRIS
jgi:hypothetical protein